MAPFLLTTARAPTLARGSCDRNGWRDMKGPSSQAGRNAKRMAGKDASKGRDTKGAAESARECT
eukprot:6210346-Pleurochrysis_carterae.AAC.1